MRDKNTSVRPFENITPKRVYFIGIGGIGMSALARWFKSEKWSVFGSDIAEGEIIQGLRKDRIEVKIGQKKGILGPKIGLFIYNQAISPSNPEFVSAKKSGVLILSYAEALGILTRHYETFTVSGAHGKSTTTSLLSLALTKAKYDPTVIVGTKLKEFGDRNFRKGKNNLLLLEADEFHSSFLNYSPTIAIITNIDKEHLDWYKNFSNVKKAFLSFIGKIKSYGMLVVNKDDKNLFLLKNQIESICKKREIEVQWYSLKDKESKKIRGVMRHIPGTHMISNALAAYYVAKYIGAKEKDILNAFKKYHGVWRRMEYKGKLKIENCKLDIDIYDDYGHHPTEIKATLSGAKKFFKTKKIICIFEPHQTKRLKLLFKEFTHAFDSANHLFLLPIYKVAGRDENEKKYTSENLSKIIQGKRKNVSYVENKKNLKQELIGTLKKINSDAVVIMMGAGTINEETKKLIETKNSKRKTKDKKLKTKNKREKYDN